MKITPFLILFICLSFVATAQKSSDSLQQKEGSAAADDPSQFFTRIELFNELQHYKNGVSLNQTILRTNVKIGKRFTTRLDIPYVHNSFSGNPENKQSGIGDISFRLLGYKIMDKPVSALTASLEVSLNTAESSLLGTGKNVVIPMITYSRLIPAKKILLALVLQQANSISGDNTRPDLSFTKIQAVALKILNRRMWTYLAPEWYIDYINGGLSMNLKSRFVIAPTRRINVWATAGAGLFGDFRGRYQWSGELGCRYFLLRNNFFNKSRTLN